MSLMIALDSLLSDTWGWTLAVLGIGLVIFVHELGHFLVAKKCGVRCEVFSLGFGPRLLGFRRGDTDYRLSLVPIGGYVKMAGDNPGEDLEGAPDELPSKSVGQRFAIFSAGVVMNLLFALVTLPIVLAIGVMFNSTQVGTVERGGAAWRAGLREGDELTRVGDAPVYNFSDVIAQVALGDPRELPVEYQRPGEEGARRAVLHPDFDSEAGRSTIGIRPAVEPWLEVDPKGPAAAIGLTREDRVVRFAERTIADPADFVDACYENVAERVELTIRGADGTLRTAVVEPRPATEPRRSIGIQAYVNEVRAVRGLADRADFLLKGDQLQAVVLGEEGSESRLAVRDSVELERGLEAAWKSEAKASLELVRDGHPRRVPLPIGPWRELSATPSTVTVDIALVQGPQQTLVRLRPGFPAEAAGIPEGSRIVEIEGKSVTNWSDITDAVNSLHAGKVAVVVETATGRRTFELVPNEVLPRMDLGMVPVYAMVKRQYGVGQAVKVGLQESAYFLKNVYLTLKKIFAREVSPKNLSGILTIAVVSKSFADSGAPRLFFFLAVLSLNLAFLNILPIPVLDGGHLLFLLVEKIKGSPVSDRVLGYSQLVGLVMVLALLLYVTYNDILRVFGS